MRAQLRNERVVPMLAFKASKISSSNSSQSTMNVIEVKDASSAAEGSIVRCRCVTSKRFACWTGCNRS